MAKTKLEAKPQIETKELSAKLWADVEKLFGTNGACGGCWCMFWRTEKGEKWDQIKGPEAKRRLKRGITAGEILGALAYANGEPVGWCSYGPRISFAKLDRSPSFACDDAEEVWSVPCFFVKAGFREMGVGRALLTQALESVARHKGVHTVEGYPAKAGKNGLYVPAFAWTGTTSLFEKAGFEPVGKKDGGKQRVRLAL